MKILTILHDFRGGGAEKVGVLLANEWSESEIFCVSEAGPFRARANVPVTSFDRRHAYAAILSLASVLRRNRDAIVVSHLTHMNVVCLIAGMLAWHRNIFVVEHNDFARARRDVISVVTRLAYLIAPLIYNFARKVICVSESVRDSLPPLILGRENRVCVIPNPIASDEFGQGDAVDLHPWFAQAIPVLVACGRLTRQKNYTMMLHALRDILRQVPVKLIVLGEGPERESLEALAALLGVSGQVDFVGFRKDPASWFAKARLIVSTSAWEGMPMTMIEALFAGANIVVTKSCSDAPKLTNRGLFGVCTAPDDISDFVDAVIEELGMPPASVTQKREFLAPYSLVVIAARYEALFQGPCTPLHMSAQALP